jgi:hypothetical protein
MMVSLVLVAPWRIISKLGWIDGYETKEVDISQKQKKRASLF